MYHYSLVSYTHLAFGMNNGLALTVSRYFGAGDENGMRRAVGWMVTLSVGTSLVLTATSLLGRGALLTLDVYKRQEQNSHNVDQGDKVTPAEHRSREVVANNAGIADAVSISLVGHTDMQVHICLLYTSLGKGAAAALLGVGHVVCPGVGAILLQHRPELQADGLRQAVVNVVEGALVNMHLALPVLARAVEGNFAVQAHPGLVDGGQLLPLLVACLLYTSGRCSSCIRERLVTDLPQPDSPTTPTVLPMGTSNETPSTLLDVYKRQSASRASG